ncbi:MAG: hypothetical protein HYV26_08895, partial [Candidatus Hydrogenedentes bacterium]|nr:hypothetical protein [Candidatus Hydrogenedentota bacterium]
LEEQYPPVPANQNAAGLYLQAAEMLEALPLPDTGVPPAAPDEAQEPLPFIGCGEPPESIDELAPFLQDRLESYLAVNNASLQLTYAGAEMAQARFSVDFWGIYISGAGSSLRSLSRLLSLDGLRHLVHQDSEGVVSALAAQMALERALAEQPQYYHFPVDSGLAWRTNELLRLALANANFTAEQLRSLRGQLEQRIDQDLDCRHSFGATLVQSRTYAYEMARMLISEDDGVGLHDEALEWLLGLVWRASGWEEDLSLTLVRGQRLLLAACNASAEEIATGDLTPQLEELASRSILVDFVFSYSDKTVDNVHVTRAIKSLAVLAIAIEESRLEHHSLPATLEELVPKFLDNVPIDPFSAGPMEYRPKNRGYVLYSWGPDREDDGGMEVGVTEKGGIDYRGGDTVFRVVR